MKMANYRKWQTRQTTALWTSLRFGTYRILSLILSLNIRWLRTIQFDFNTLKTFQLGTYQFVTSCIQTFYLAMCWITTISVNICRKNGYFTRSHKDIMPKDANRELDLFEQVAAMAACLWGCGRSYWHVISQTACRVLPLVLGKYVI